MKTPQPLSVTMITFNEEDRVQAALESVRWADEIVVVDSLSTDATVEICRGYTDCIYQIPWHGYVEQKNIATDKASHDWVLNLDADERLSPKLAEEIQAALLDPAPNVGFYVPRRTFYLGGWIEHCGWYPDYKLRVYRKTFGKWVGQALHEQLDIQGPGAYLRHDLYHYPYRNISEHIQTMDNYSAIVAAHTQRTTNGAEILARTMFTFFKKYVLKQGFRDGTRGIIISLFSAFTVALKYAKLWEHQQCNQNQES